MKNLLVFFVVLTILACGQDEKQSSQVEPSSNPIDLEEELASIEETRQGFQLAIKEKRYEDVGGYTTSDMRAISPGGEDWMEYKRSGEKLVGQFRYDSLIIQPQETVLVSDTVAYDFGTSSVYYTNEEGEPVELSSTFLVILKKDKNDGVWKLHREVSSSMVE